jgi:histidinol-phosphate aminotransferase
MVLRTFSKAYGLAGLRLGYALAHPVVTRLLSRVKVPWNIPAIVLAAASAALDDEAEQAQRLGTLRAAREELRTQLARMPGLRPLPSEGNFVLVDVSATELKAESWVAMLLAEGVLVRSLSVHHESRTAVRVTVGTVEQNQRCVAAFERVLQKSQRPARPFLTAQLGDAE